MIKKLLILLLVTAVAFQSIAAVTDLHESHQSGVEHLEFEHEHESTDEGSIEAQQLDSDSFDCHHCCHCHGEHVTSLLLPELNLVFVNNNQSLSSTNQNLKYSGHFQILRPPKFNL